ncbi:MULTISPECIES: hypothetical protein [unclassified Pseudomonas]|uniref:hypothetical protein n=1 Tax=unclassified Pseudomonas TaxID=196821 RepID=UPI000C86A03E|nr:MULTISPECIES: hypothetical protein [unclassified Pseudomonas]MBU0521659.1 hypothetical protein [Gammaproteobacteria bacterium]MBU0840568.1 hypothetical protein [Gammaproteobacteria bacterium]MBU1838306.1 hypothetical protein [Gammaproteobacteria bacterium]PMV91974.1 hypothetical protein C1X55_29605 [Pseudomonas sp. GW460-C8]PMW10526.1 hypothetical protein C1X40_30175 [Pseudomonas sp. GW456-11-11-14-TSB2]
MLALRALMVHPQKNGMPMVTVEKKSNLATVVKIGLAAVVAVGLLADRMVWVDQVVGRINLANARIADVNCSAGDWLEVAPGKDAQQPMRYRCGFMFWPFYRSGESLFAADALNKLRS